MRLFGALALAWLLLNLPVLLGLRVTPWDSIDEFYPTVYFNAHTLRSGMLPWWNPHIYAGYPQIADPQGMLFSPLLMAWMLLLKTPGATWFNWGVLLHLLMGGAAMLGLLRRSGAKPFGRLIGAIVFMAGGVAAARLEHVPDVLAYAWSPVVLLALRYFLSAPDLRRGLLFGLAAAALITQLVQVTYLLVLMIVGYFFVASLAHWRRYGAAQRWQWMGGVMVAVLVALIGGLPQLIFSWAYVALSNRASLPLAAAADASLDPRALLSLIDPNAWQALRGEYSGPASRVESFLYIGALPMLFLLGLRKAWRPKAQRRQLLFFGAVAVLACLYMFGVHAFFYRWLYGWLPGISQFRRPSDAAYLLNFSLAIMAGLGASHVELGSRRQMTAVLAVAALWLGLASAAMHGNGARWQAATLLGAIVALLALWRLRREGSVMRTAAWLIVVLLVDYRCFNLNGSFNQGHDNAQRFRRDAAVTQLIADSHETRGALPYRIEPVQAGVLWDNYVALTDLQSTQGYNPLRYGLYDQWYGAHENGNFPRINRPFNPSVASTLDNLLSVRRVVVGHKQGEQTNLSARGLTQVFRGERVDVWQNPRAYPRVLNPSEARLLSPQGAPLPGNFAATDFNRTVWLTPRDAQDWQGARGAATVCSGKVDVDHLQAQPGRLDFQTQAASAGWLVLGELDFPGWQATVDNRPLAIHRANGMFRAVCVPAGKHAVRFAFHPWQMVAQVWATRSQRTR